MQILQSKTVMMSAHPLFAGSKSTICREAQNSFAQNTLINKIFRKHCVPTQIKLLSETRKIKPKMFTKVANWMEKMTFETLQFSYETFQIALKTMINFLNKVDETPSNLQMLACVALHIASKVNEPKIVAIASYIECCMNLFDRQKFEEKEIQVYQALQFKVETETIHKVWNFIEDSCEVSSESADKWKKLINNLLKDPKNYLLSIQSIAIHLMVFCKAQIAEVDIDVFIEEVRSENLL